jgi:REP element-mobilizing transposase RayT
MIGGNMSRKFRIDAAGAIHHVIARGINRADIFSGDTDYKSFLNRLGAVLTGTKTACYEWALMPNHFICCFVPETHRFLW